MLDVIGSASPRDDEPQQALPSPLVTRSAALPYLSFTTALMSWSAMVIRLRRSRASDGRQEPSHVVDRLRVQRVVDPPALPAVHQQAGVLQRFEMERQARLPALQRVGEIADALF